MDVTDLEKVYIQHEQEINEIRQQIIALEKQQSGVTISLQWISTSLDKLETGINKKFDGVDKYFESLQKQIEEIAKKPGKQWDSIKIASLSTALSTITAAAITMFLTKK